MRLLVCTQRINKNDPELGFFHEWVKALSAQFSSILVICLEKGDYELPDNVRVLSLGKERKRSRFIYIKNFLTFVFNQNTNYDRVFVHMNQEYVLLGGLFWRLMGKKIFLWRNHPQGSWLTSLAVLISNTVFFTSPQSFTARFKKAIQMPVGIDTDFFHPNQEIQKTPNSILFLGRVSPVKNVALFVQVLNQIKQLGVDFVATIAGSVANKDLDYASSIKKMVSDYGLNDHVQFVGSLNRQEARNLFWANKVYVNLTPSGSLDKTIFESMSCGAVPVLTNIALRERLGHQVVSNDSLEIANMIIKSFSNNQDYSLDVIRQDSLRILTSRLSEVIGS